MMTTSMMTTMTNQRVVEGISNPLTELPVLGGIVKIVNSLLTDLGIPLWIAETIELAGLLWLLHVLLLKFIRRALPWLVTVFEPLVVLVFERVAMILLIPEVVTTRLRIKLDKPPLAFAYTYGDGVLSLTGFAVSVAHFVLALLPRASRAPRGVSLVLVILFVLAWNNGTCTSSSTPAACISPASSWASEAGRWFEATVH
jgi:hypothetical protein